MDEPGFRRFLKGRGKKEHVVEGLLRQVQHFEAYLARERQATLESAVADDIQQYVDASEAADAGSVKERLRGLALYYSFAGNAALASLANDLREERIAGSRKSFQLREFRGANPDDIARLEAAGIGNADQMLAAGRTPADREALARRTGIAPQAILGLVKLSDLSRIGGLKAIRARLYYDGGFDSLDKIAASDPDKMRGALAAFVERTGFEGIAPLPKEARNAVATARALPRLVEY